MVLNQGCRVTLNFVDQIAKALFGGMFSRRALIGIDGGVWGKPLDKDADFIDDYRL